MRADYHLHTRHCRHASDEADAYARAAWENGMDEIGFSDHIPSPGWQEDVQRGMPREELDAYVREVQELAGEFPGRVRLGLEVDYVPGYGQKLALTKQDYPFDYWLGSVHFIPAWSHGYLRDYRDRPPDEAYRLYFALVGEAAASGLYEVMAHIDLIRRFVPEPELETLLPLEEALAGAIIRAGVAVELNASSLRGKRPGTGLFPGPRLLKRLADGGVAITFGSDAHAAAEAGKGVAEAAALAVAAGFTNFVRFRRGERILTPL